MNSNSTNTPTSSLTTPSASTTTPQASVVIKNSFIPSSSTPKTSIQSKFKKSLITKKKLEFAAHKHLESDKPEDVDVPTNIEDLDVESLTLLVEEKRNKLEVLKRHQAEKQELTNLIERWKEAGLAALNQLRNFSQEPKTDEQILDSFKIPHDAFL